MEMRQLYLEYDKKELNVLVHAAGIRLEPGLEYCCGIYEGERLIACGGYENATIKCLAVLPHLQGEGLMSKLISHLYSTLRKEGKEEIFIFSKPKNAKLFRSLGFVELARVEMAALFTSRASGLQTYLRGIKPPATAPVGAIVMNANPFTLGHRYLVSEAASQCATLLIFVLEENKSAYSFETRLRLVREGVNDIQNAFVYGGGPYMISRDTFPSYFLKDPSGAAQTYAQLDAALFAKRIAPKLNITKRFVGSEPLDPLTSLYNETLKEILPKVGIEVNEIPRLELDGGPVSASRVRTLVDEGKLAQTRPLLPATTFAYLEAQKND
ncbi:[citrate (pro-3S)-lyase] ligase [Eubacteriales bacterium OttesenSCG-928-K08]|nr:[citrate (pro-3S)-lyase] ligase [Eubacteriales bacterium OttesenSCG-928-K08]